jgi:hypothetical protein
METHCGIGAWKATAEFPFRAQGSILQAGFGGLKWNFNSGEKVPFDALDSILHNGISILEHNFSPSE